jgi:polar amino acid transport system permease protein
VPFPGLNGVLPCQLMFDFGAILKHIPFLLKGAEVTLLLSLSALMIGMCIGLVVALLRLSPSRALRFAAGLYVDVLRSTPLLAQLMWLFFALPILTGIALSPFAAGVLGLALYAGAYLSEVYRSGILAIPQGQWHASLALGMTTSQLLRRVILPQAIFRVLPPLASLCMSLLKDSSLVSAISLQELMYRGQALGNLTLHQLEALTVTATIYFVATYPFALLGNALHRRYQV